MPFPHFFKKRELSNKVNAGGPPREDQLLAMAHDKYWVVLNTHLLSTCTKGTVLCDRVNALKHALQTYGPVGKQLPDCRDNKGKAKSHVFHGHVQDSNGTTYVLEWTVIDPKNRVMALLGFDSHENYKFRQSPLTAKECEKIVSTPENIKKSSYAQTKIKEAKAKVQREEKEMSRGSRDEIKL